MNEVSKKSVNGGSQVSGGFIFDQMDRFAHDYWKKEYNTKGYLFTSDAMVFFNKQICNWGDMQLKAKMIDIVVEPTAVLVSVLDKDFNEYAWGMFRFVEKDHAYCDTKGGGVR